MRLTRSATASAAVAVSLTVAACGGGAGGPQSGGSELTDDKITLGVITDLSGVYSDLAGENAVEAVRMAVDDFKAEHGDDAVTTDIDVVSADHQNKPEIANTQAAEFYDRQGVDAIFDVPTSSAALAVANVAKTKQKLFVAVGPATTELTGAQCNTYTFHWAYDTYMLANGTGTAVTEGGATDWYIVYPDYAFGQDMEQSFTTAIEAAGGTIVESDPTPFPNDNFATFLTKAPSLDPKPDVVGTMQAGGDLVNFVKQYNEFGLKDQGIGLALGLVFDTDIAAIGPDELAGSQFTAPWFWTLDEEAETWADAFMERTGTRPTFDHAGNYSAARQYLEAVQETGTDDADTVVGELEGKKVEDIFLRNGEIRAADHRVIHDAYLVEVKPTSEAREEADYTTLVDTIPAADAFRPAEDSGCQMGG
ncbi:MAG: ABC transporter substrate-binding protein [Micromonosporaceae bacterium]